MSLSTIEKRPRWFRRTFVSHFVHYSTVIQYPRVLQVCLRYSFVCNSNLEDHDTDQQQRPQPSHFQEPLHRDRTHLRPNLHLDPHPQPTHLTSLHPHPSRPSLLLQPRHPPLQQPLPRLWRLPEGSAQDRSGLFCSPSNIFHRRSTELLPTKRLIRRRERKGLDDPTQPSPSKPQPRPRKSRFRLRHRKRRLRVLLVQALLPFFTLRLAFSGPATLRHCAPRPR